MEKTKIDWTDSTWNPVTGCMHSCKYCYARRMIERFGKASPIDGKNIKSIPTVTGNIVEIENRVGNPYPVDFIPALHKYRLNDYEKKKGRNIFVCSMADLFGNWVPDGWIEQVFSACDNAPQHNYMFLTKNPSRYDLLCQNNILRNSENMWYGYSFTHNKASYWSNPKFNIFASIEPILEPIEKLPPANWIIVGAETGTQTDKTVPEKEWIADMVEKCRQENIPLFMKSSLLDIWGNELIQEFPEPLKHGNNIA